MVVLSKLTISTFLNDNFFHSVCQVYVYMMQLYF